MINDAKELNRLLKENKDVKEFFELKKLLEENEYITQLLKTIKQTQQEAKQCLNEHNMAEYKIKVAVLETLKKEFIEHPLVNNYLIVKEEVRTLLDQIVNILSE